jgi:DNA-binding transcriptional regulator PaaX
LLFLGGLTLGLSRSPRQQFRIIKNISYEWKKIEDRALKRAIGSLYESKLIGRRQNKDGSITIFLSQEGKKKALTFKLDEIKINKPQKWDKKWRVVLFDIPESMKKMRDILR